MQRKKICYKLLDFDNCLGTANYEVNEQLDLLNNPLQYRNWLIQNNKAFLDQLVEEIKTAKYNLVVIANGSNRQSCQIDLVNHYNRRNGSFAWMLPIVQSYLAERLPGIEVVLDPFILSDVYGKNKKAGDNYKAILRKLMGDETQDHSDNMFNEKKISLVYPFAHRAVILNPNAEIDMDFYDDYEPIIRSLANLIKPDDAYGFLPELNLSIFQYETGTVCKKFRETIKGKGKTDEHYDWSIRLMSAKTYLQTFAAEDLNLKTAEALSAYHFENHYSYPGRQLQMNFPNNFSPVSINNFGMKDFVNLRDQIVTELDSDPDLVRTSNYTTMEKLYQEGLIPKELTNPLSASPLSLFVGSKPSEESTVVSELTEENNNTMKKVGMG